MLAESREASQRGRLPPTGLYSRSTAGRSKVFPAYPLLQAGLLQDGDLPGMVKLVLGDAFEHEADVVSLAGHAFAEPRVGKRRHRFQKGGVSLLRVNDSLFPRCCALVFNGRKILRLVELEGFPNSPKHDAAIHSIVPGSNVQNEFPNAVGVGKWMRGGGGGLDVREKFKQGGTVPRLALEGA